MLNDAGTYSGFCDRVRETGNMLSSEKAKAHDLNGNMVQIHEVLGQELKAKKPGQVGRN